METDNQLPELFERYLNNQCSEDDIRLLQHYFGNAASGPDLAALVQQHLHQSQPGQTFPALADEAWQKIEKHLHKKPAGNGRTIAMKWQLARVAALLFLVGGLATVSYYLFRPKGQNPDNTSIVRESSKSNVLPGTEKAILTLADGRKIELDSSGRGVIAAQGTSSIVLSANGQIEYKPGSSNDQILLNQVATPRGGQFRVVLPDGSKAWLNASSSIKYPVSFTGKSREVEITGEVYFDVTHNSQRPFRVKSGDFAVEVLGTAFNVNAYTDEPARKTTLIRGAVLISSPYGSATLKPGDQAVIAADESLNVHNNVDTEEIIAWTNGSFLFNSQEIRSILRQISRWYDVDVVYQGVDGKEPFSGMMSKSSTIDQVIRILEAGGVHLRLEGKKLIVLP